MVRCVGSAVAGTRCEKAEQPSAGPEHWRERSGRHIKRTRGCAPRPFVSLFVYRPGFLVVVPLIVPGLRPAARELRSLRGMLFAAASVCLPSGFSCFAALRVRAARGPSRWRPTSRSGSHLVSLAAARPYPWCLLSRPRSSSSPFRLVLFSLRAPPWAGGFLAFVCWFTVGLACGGRSVPRDVSRRVFQLVASCWPASPLLFDSSSVAFNAVFLGPVLCAELVRGGRGFIRVWGFARAGGFFRRCLSLVGVACGVPSASRRPLRFTESFLGSRACEAMVRSWRGFVRVRVPTTSCDLVACCVDTRRSPSALHSLGVAAYVHSREVIGS